MSKFEDVVRQRQCFKKFQDNCISKDQLDVMIKTYNSNKFKRYFLNHKGRTIFMIICIILLFVCALTEYPIDGSINTGDTFSKFMSVVGFIAANVFLALLFTILGVETFMSREELNEIKIELPNVIEEEIEKNKSKSGFMQYLQTKLSKLTRQKSNKYLSKIAVSEPDKNGEGEKNIDLCDIKSIIYSSLSVDQLTQLYEDVKKFNE